jgi:prophage antirepressor-like protein
MQTLSFINEGNLYRLIIKSRKPEAERFESWVCDDVLPTIRKTGQYVAPKPRPERTRKALPGGLTLEQQDAIKALVKSRVEVLPHDAQAKAAITCWSSIKSKFGVSYKAVPADQFTEVLSLVARLELEKGGSPKALPLDLNYPLESARPPAGCNGLSFYAFAQAEGWSDPNWELLMKLKAAGVNVDGPIYSHQAKIHIMTAMYNGLLGKMREGMDVMCAQLAYAPIYLR